MGPGRRKAKARRSGQSPPQLLGSLPPGRSLSFIGCAAEALAYDWLAALIPALPAPRSWYPAVSCWRAGVACEGSAAGSWRARYRPLQVTEAQRGPPRRRGERDAEGARVPVGGGKCGERRYRWQLAGSLCGLLPWRPGSSLPKVPPNAPTRNPQPASRAYSRSPKPVQPANQLRDPRRLPPGLALGPCPASSPPSPKLSAPRLCPPLTRSALGASAPPGEAGRPRRSGLPQGRAAQRASGPTVCRALIYSS